jgi:hypothetical protein
MNSSQPTHLDINADQAFRHSKRIESRSAIKRKYKSDLQEAREENESLRKELQKTRGENALLKKMYNLLQKDMCALTIMKERQSQLIHDAVHERVVQGRFEAQKMSERCGSIMSHSTRDKHKESSPMSGHRCSSPSKNKVSLMTAGEGSGTGTDRCNNPLSPGVNKNVSTESDGPLKARAAAERASSPIRHLMRCFLLKPHREDRRRHVPPPLQYQSLLLCEDKVPRPRTRMLIGGRMTPGMRPYQGRALQKHLQMLSKRRGNRVSTIDHTNQQGFDFISVWIAYLSTRVLDIKQKFWAENKLLADCACQIKTRETYRRGRT